tara:strand:- start:907 stop:1257 length:351 start_codon:yes stop_codon:yes gene_type:complete
MEKFLSIPVLDKNGTNSQNQLVSITGIKIIKQTTTTAVRIDYVDGKQTLLTWPASPTYSAPILLESVETAVKKALASGWTNVVEQYNPKGFVAGTAVEEEPGSAANTNPLATIAIT